MKALFIFGIVIVVFFLFSRIRVGGWAEYSDCGLLVRLRLGALKVTVYPPKKKKQKQTAPKEKKTEAPRPGGNLDLLRQFLPLLAETAGHLKEKIRVDQMDLDLTVGAPNPALAALAFGGANAMIGMIIPLMENNFNVKERRIRTMVDYNRTSPLIDVRAAFSLTIGQGVILILRLGKQALHISQHQRAQKQKEAV